MRIELFGSRVSPFVEKVARALQLKGLAFSLVPVRSPSDFKRWNPQAGKMPVLQVDGERLIDSTFILRRLDELVPEPALFDPDPATAARQRFVEDWSDEALYWYGMGLRWADENAAATAIQVTDTIPLPAVVKPLLRRVLRRRIGGQARAQGLARLPLATLTAELGRRLDELIVLLDRRPFFFADRPGAADVAVFGQLHMQRSGPTPQAERLLRERPALLAYYDRVDAATGTHADAPVRASTGDPGRLAMTP